MAMKQKAQAKKDAQAMSAQQISGHDSNRALYTVYGNALIGSTVVWKKVSDKRVVMSHPGFTGFQGGGGTPGGSNKDTGSNRYLYRATSLCNGPIESVDDIIIDGESYKASRFTNGTLDHFQCAVSLGPQSGQDFAKLRETYTDFSSWDSTKLGKAAAYSIERLYLRKSKNAYQGEPQTQYLIKGRLLYDPRLDSTQIGGSGLHRHTDASTWAYSDNPALATLDYLTNAEYGRGLEITDVDVPSIVAAANRCDSLVDIPAKLVNNTGSSITNYVPYLGSAFTASANSVIDWYRPQQTTIQTQQKRFRINIAIDNAKEVLENVQEILNCYRANLIHINGKYVVRMEDVASSILSLGDDDIIGGLKVVAGERRQRINRMTIKFLNEKQRSQNRPGVMACHRFYAIRNLSKRRFR